MRNTCGNLRHSVLPHVQRGHQDTTALFASAACPHTAPGLRSIHQEPSFVSMKSQTLDLQTQQRSLYTLALAPLVPVLAVLSALRLYISFALEAVVHYIQGSRARRRKNVYLQGNYAPQYRESHFQELSVEGEIPKALNGVFMR